MDGNDYLVSRIKWLRGEKIRLQKELKRIEKEIVQIELKIQKQSIDKIIKICYNIYRK